MDIGTQSKSSWEEKEVDESIDDANEEWNDEDVQTFDNDEFGVCKQILDNHSKKLS